MYRTSRRRHKPGRRLEEEELRQLDRKAASKRKSQDLQGIEKAVTRKSPEEIRLLYIKKRHAVHKSGQMLKGATFGGLEHRKGF